MLGKRLPNGWQVALSNGQTVSSKRIRYEAKGVPVDVAVTHYRSDMLKGLDLGLDQAFRFLPPHQTELAQQTRCYEQLAFDFYVDSLLVTRSYGAVTAYSTGLVEEDATLLTPFANVCRSLRGMANENRIQQRI